MVFIINSKVFLICGLILKTAFQGKVVGCCFVPSCFYTVCSPLPHHSFCRSRRCVVVSACFETSKKLNEKKMASGFFTAVLRCTLCLYNFMQYCSWWNTRRNCKHCSFDNQNFFSGLSGFQRSFCPIRFNRNDLMWNWITYIILKAFYDDSGTKSGARLESALFG